MTTQKKLSYQERKRKLRKEIRTLLDDYPQMRERAQHAMRGVSLKVLYDMKLELKNIDSKYHTPKKKEKEIEAACERTQGRKKKRKVTHPEMSMGM